MYSRGKHQNIQYVSQELRSQRKFEREQILEAVYQHKKQEMMDIKKQKEINNEKKVKSKIKLQEIALAKTQAVKEQEALGNLRKREFMENKIRTLKLEKDREVQKEEAIKKKKEAEILYMEKLEMELIKKLEQTQKLQKEAYEEFEYAVVKTTHGGSNSSRKLYEENKGLKLSAREKLAPLNNFMNKEVIKERSFDSDSNVDERDEIEKQRRGNDFVVETEAEEKIEKRNVRDNLLPVESIQRNKDIKEKSFDSDSNVDEREGEAERKEDLLEIDNKFEKQLSDIEKVEEKEEEAEVEEEKDELNQLKDLKEMSNE